MIPWFRLRAPRSHRVRLTVESLEDRITPSGFIVTDTSDSSSDPGSLRHAVVRANADTRANDVFTITFAPSLAGQTIALGSTLELTNTTAGLTIAIDDSAAPGLTIAGDGSTFSVFTVDAHVTADFSGLTISQGGTSGNGGGMLNRQGNVAIDHCVFSSDSAMGGGAIANLRGTMIIQNSTLSGDSATVLGGAIENNLGMLSVQSCTLAGNITGSDGGAIFNVGTLTVSDTTVSGNTASGGEGGGIENFVGTVTATNVTLSGNTAGDGGAIGNEGTLNVLCATISGNTTTRNGGGVENAGTLSLQNSIVAANTANGLGDDVDGGITTDLGNNLLGTNVNASGAGDAFTDTPGLAALGYYGGAMETMAVLPGSPAHHAGNAAAVGLPTTDETGGARTVLGQLDVGAYQTQANPLLVTTAADTDGLAGQLTLREAVRLANLYAAAGTAANITFAPGLQGATITLTQGVLELSGAASKGTAAITITGQTPMTLSGNAASGVLQVDSGVTTTVSGLTITGGNAMSGGGILNNGTLTVTDCTFSGDATSGNGGAIASTGTLTVNHCTFTTNAASGGDGGAIDNAGPATVTDSTFTGNTASGNGGGIGGTGSWTITHCTFNGNAASGGDGGGVDGNDNSATVRVAGSTFTNNTASGNGGGIAGIGTLVVSGCSFTGNAATGGNGGGIVAPGTLTVLSSAVIGNTAGGNGGGIAVGGAATIESSTVGRNTASGNGGGIANSGTLTVEDSTIGANSATESGGIDNSGTLTILTSTVSTNSASDQGGGITNNGTLTLQNTILSGNTAVNGSPDLNGPLTTDLGNNLLGTLVYAGPAPPTDIVADSPGIAPLGTYGGVLQTMPILPNSKAHNTGNARAPGLPTADEIGAPRITAGRLDIGAYQMHANPLVVTTLADPGGMAGQVSLREAIHLANAYAAGGNPATITFAPSLQGGTITLNQGALELSGVAPKKAAAIGIVGLPGLTLSGGGTSGVFQIDAGVTAAVSGFTIEEGNAANGGGILNNGTLTLSNCTLTGDTATGAGGAIDNAGTLTMANCTLTGNAAGGNGGGIASSGILAIQSTTLSGNTADGSGGGIASTFKLTLENTILSANIATISAPDLSGIITTDRGNNLLGTAVYTGPAPRSDIVTDTPGLAPLGGYGGALPTLALLPTSLALGRGNPAAPGRPASDERGFARVAAGRLDIGAFQSQVQPFVVTTAADPDSLPGQLALRQAINLAEVYAAVGRAADITFAANLRGDTITLTHGALHLTAGSGTITIDGGHTIAISGNGTSALFAIDAGASAILTGLAITHGTGSGIQNAGMLTVQSCTLSGNAAGGNGAGITNSGTLILTDTTLSGNTAGGDGGAIANSGMLAIQSCTISGNSASSGGGIANTGWLTLQNSIVSANTATGASPDILGSITVDGGNNLLGTALATGTSWTSDIFTDTPGLATLGNYGGGLPTMALLPGSLALGAGSATGAPVTDERGIARRRDSHGRPIVDIGAFESRGFTISIVAGNAQSAHIGQAFARPLIVMVTPRNALEPVNGGIVWFTAQTGSAGQSALLSSATATISARKATVRATANGIVRTYAVTVSTGIGTAMFQLRNL